MEKRITDHKKEFKEFVEKVGAVYETIAEKIEELLEALNTLNTAQRNDPQINELAEAIVKFLRKMEESVMLEEEKAKKVLSGQKQKSFLVFIHDELFKIKELEVYLALAESKPKPEIISRINKLYSQIREEIDAEESLLRNAA
ncbi:MAG: hypothetical protein AB1668_01185 [Nanoarchaeota archaeon]